MKKKFLSPFFTLLFITTAMAQTNARNVKHPKPVHGAKAEMYCEEKRNPNKRPAAAIQKNKATVRRKRG
jgi:hypothetical protein